MRKLSESITPTYSEAHDIPPNPGCCGPIAFVALVGKIVKNKVKRK